MEYVQKFADFVESGDVNTRLKPKYNLNQAEDVVRFTKFIYQAVEDF